MNNTNLETFSIYLYYYYWFKTQVAIATIICNMIHRYLFGLVYVCPSILAFAHRKSVILLLSKMVTEMLSERFRRYWSGWTYFHLSTCLLTNGFLLKFRFSIYALRTGFLCMMLLLYFLNELNGSGMNPIQVIYLLCT